MITASSSIIFQGKIQGYFQCLGGHLNSSMSANKYFMNHKKKNPANILSNFLGLGVVLL